MAIETENLEERLRRLSRPGELYDKLPDGTLHCYACGHNCKIKDGRAGVCRVRFNEGGVLKVPWGYVGALQLDPIEKKPFFHALPGAKALSFGMLGCDYHCHFCLLPGQRVPTEIGMVPIESLEGGSPLVYSHTGALRRIVRFLMRSYSGQVVEIKAAYAPPIRCTPDHPVLVWSEADVPVFRPAGSLGRDDLLAIPRSFSFSRNQVLDVASFLEPLSGVYRKHRVLERLVFTEVMRLAAEGLTSREIGLRVGKSGSHVRHIHRKAAQALGDGSYGLYKGRLLHEDGLVRFTQERSPGLPAVVAWDVDLARLAGYYCAEGSVTLAKGRVASATLAFSFGPKEAPLAEEVSGLLRKVFGVSPWRVSGPTYERVGVSKASLAALFSAVCGKGACEKRVPQALFNAKREIVEAYLATYAKGDGWVGPNGKTTVTTVSEELAWGVAWLLTKLGKRPMLYSYRQQVHRRIMGRWIKQKPRTFMVRWPWSGKNGTGVREDARFLYVPVRSVRRRSYSGPVYNLEVEKDHTFLAGFVATHNCQNFVTSQALRDPLAGAPPQECSPEELVAMAKQQGAPVITSTYNEPLITSEWAVAVFKAAKEAGLRTSYVSNGNGTPEVIRYLKPWVDFYKVDLKGFDDAHYRRIMGGTLKAVLDTIPLLVDMKFWVEIVTLIIPGVNDSDEELRSIAKFLAGVSKDLPWHVTAFHKDYKMTDPDETPASTLVRAAEIGRAEGLRYIYAGNLPGEVGDWENTRCPDCRTLLVERYGFKVRRVSLRLEGSKGFCPNCSREIPGAWA